MRKLNLITLSSLISISALFAGTARAADFDSGNVMNCQLEGGGLVQLNVNDGKTTFVLDSRAKQQLQPVNEAMTKDISGAATLAELDPKQGYGHYYELLEIEGQPGQNICQTWLWFQVKPGVAKESVQAFGKDGTIPLAHEKSYNYFSCPGHDVKIQSCKAGLDLKSLSDLREFFITEIPD